MHEHWEAGLDMKKVHSLEELRTNLLAYVHKYNRTPHTSLDGKTP